VPAERESDTRAGLPGCGDAIGPYTLLRSIGGQVFEAAGQAGERLALKLIPELALSPRASHDERAAQEARRARFLDELSAVTGLAHPNLASVLDGDLDKDYGWVVWPLFDGDSLAARRRAGQDFAEEDILAITAAVSAAAAALHAAGLGHGGIAAQNVLLVDDGGRDRVILTEAGSFPTASHHPDGDRVSRHTDDRAATREALFGPGGSAHPAAGSAAPLAPASAPAPSGPTSIFELAPTSRKRPVGASEATEIDTHSDRSSPTIAPSRGPSAAAPKPSSTAPSATSERTGHAPIDRAGHPTDRRLVVGLALALVAALAFLWWQRSAPPAPHGLSGGGTLAAASVPAVRSASASAPSTPSAPSPASAGRPPSP
jgi:serine/threonine protein kinase